MTGPDTDRRELAVDPAALSASADRMDALADRLRTALTSVERAGNPVPAGGDEVSVWAAPQAGEGQVTVPQAGALSPDVSAAGATGDADEGSAEDEDASAICSVP